MYIAFIVGLFSVLSAYLSRYKEYKNGLTFSFILIFLFSALRYKYGSDYPTYLASFQEFNRALTPQILDFSRTMEPGWFVLCYIFKPFGFFALTAFFALINCIVFYRFIKIYLPINYYWIAVFIYVFSPNLLLLSLSGYRQYLAIAIFLFSLQYIDQKKPFHYFFCITIASFFHFSVVIMFPIYLLRFFTWKINRMNFVIILVFFISLFFFGEFLQPLLYSLLEGNFTKYTGYLYVSQTKAVFSSGLGFSFIIVLCILTLYYERIVDRRTALLFKIAIIGFMFFPLNLFFDWMDRISFYFVPSRIIVFTSIFIYIKQPMFKIIFICALIIYTLYTYYAFMNDDLWKPSYGTYQTIFSSPEFY